MYKEDLALNNLQWLICHKTQPNQTKCNVTKKSSSSTIIVMHTLQIMEAVEIHDHQHPKGILIYLSHLSSPVISVKEGKFPLLVSTFANRMLYLLVIFVYRFSLVYLMVYQSLMSH